MRDCPACKKSDCRKDGIVGGRQRYYCKSCGYRHTVSHKWYSEETKRQALTLYLEGLGFRSIGRLLNCSHVAVYQWIKQYGNKAQLSLPTSDLDVVEMDEMHSYVGSKKKPAGYGSRLTDVANAF